MSYWKDYAYVDAHYEHPVTKKRTKWKRILDRDAKRRVIDPSRGSNCFTSVQRFKDATSLLQINEETARLRKKADKNRSEQERLDELLAYGDDLPEMQSRYHGLFFDFDSVPGEGETIEIALERARKDANKLVDWFISTFEIGQAHIQCWFSGKKGFHVTIRPEVFGVVPHPHLTLIAKSIAFELADMLNLKTLDRTVYSSSRMWRIPNTTHPATGKYKIELTAREMERWDIEKIQKTASGPRDEVENHRQPKGSAEMEANPNSFVWERCEYEDIETDVVAAAWYQERFNDYEAYRDLQNVRPRAPIKTFSEAGEEWPPCVKDIWDNGPKEGGPGRNRVTLPLVGFMYDAGMEKRTAEAEIGDWTSRHFPEERWIRSRLANAKSVVESAYRGQVRFSCRFIRSCGGTGQGGKVRCVGEDNCKWVREAIDQEPDRVPMLHLSEASKGCYDGVKIRTAIHVATVARGPFGLPQSGTLKCSPNPEAKMCQGCPVGPDGSNGEVDWCVDSEERAVLAMVNVSDSVKIGTLKQMCGVPQKCTRTKIDVEATSNVEEVQVIPMVDFDHSYMVEDDDDIGVRASRHVVRTAYYIGHGIEANKKYIIEPTVFMHPKDQVMCFLFDKMEPAQNDIDQFEMTEDLQESLKVFQVAAGETIEEKLIQIHRDLTVNVHQIGGRFDLSIAVDLCYHSVIAFKFIGQMVTRGYFELVVVGDSGSGKSTLVERMMRHFGLGEMIAGEDAKRTGLVYSSTQVNGQWVLRWGKIPQNDRRLLVIDEFAAMPVEEIGKMTQLRSEGRARGGGVSADYETFARTRLICLTNPRGNARALSGYNFGVMALRGIYGEMQDLRRVDLAVVADKEDVPKDMLNKRWDRVNRPHEYTADLCRNLILWAWSRDPRHVKWSSEAEDEAIKWANVLGDTYACDIPLAQASDLRIKIARIACAVAARVFSTDDTCTHLLVNKEHVEFAAMFMDRSYRKDSMSYFEYARGYKQDNYISDEKRKRIREMLGSFGEETPMIIRTLVDTDLLKKMKFSDMVNLEIDDFKRLWKFLVNERLLVQTARGYRRTEGFTKLLRKREAKTTNYHGGLSDAIETGGIFDEDMTMGPEDQPPPPKAPPVEVTEGTEDDFFLDDPLPGRSEPDDEPDF